MAAGARLRIAARPQISEAGRGRALPVRRIPCALSGIPRRPPVITGAAYRRPICVKRSAENRSTKETNRCGRRERGVAEVVRIVNMHEASTHLSRLVDGEFIIARDGRPVARVVPIRDEPSTPTIGFMPEITVPEDLDQMGSAEIGARGSARLDIQFAGQSCPALGSCSGQGGTLQ